MWLYLLLPIFLAQQPPVYEASVVEFSGQYILLSTAHKDAPTIIAWGRFEDALESDGWGKLDIGTSGNFNDSVQAYAAGMIEGYMTAHRIYDHWVNVQDIMYSKGTPQEVKDFFEEQRAWSADQIKQNSATDDIWHHVEVIESQFDGLVEGYNQAAATSKGVLPKLDDFAFSTLNGVGDLFQIQPAVVPSERIDWASLPQAKARKLFHERTHCSALVKVRGGLEDLMFGHSSWFQFSHTNRIYKTYDFALQSKATAAKRMSFSSYPGFLESLDDFYMMDSGLGMTQTSNEVFNNTLLDLIKPQSLLAWQRVRLANVLSRTGEDWFHYFNTHPSGTYVNQYMITDYKLWEAGKPLKDGVLWVIEEQPGLILGEDVTNQLERGYWPSYNVPYFEQIWWESGYGIMAARDTSGTGFWEYDLAPRAKIFRRDAGKVDSVDDLKDILRYNDFKNDPYSFDGTQQNAMWAICSRGDLNENPSYGGCYDTKVTSEKHGFWNMTADILNGPTQGGGAYTPFSWSNLTQKHQGLPQTYDFPFITVKPFTQWPE